MWIEVQRAGARSYLNVSRYDFIVAADDKTIFKRFVAGGRDEELLVENRLDDIMGRIENAIRANR